MCRLRGPPLTPPGWQWGPHIQSVSTHSSLNSDQPWWCTTCSRLMSLLKWFHKFLNSLCGLLSACHGLRQQQKYKLWVYGARPPGMGTVSCNSASYKKSLRWQHGCRPAGHGMESGTCCVCWEEFGPSEMESGLWQKMDRRRGRVRASGIRIKQWLWGLLGKQASFSVSEYVFRAKKSPKEGIGAQGGWGGDRPCNWVQGKWTPWLQATTC